MLVEQFGMLALRSAFYIAGLLLVCASAVSAQEYDSTTLTAGEIFAKARAAYGSYHPGIYRKVSTVHTGGVDRTVTQYFRDKDERTVVEGGGFSTSSGTIDGQDWTQNENGIVTLESGFHEKTNPNVLALAHADDPTYHVRVLGITTQAPRAFVVDVNPPGGYDERRYYDASTFLLIKVVRFRRDRYNHVSEYSDFRTVAGRVVPFKIHSFDGRPQNDTVTTVVSLDRTGSPADLAMPAGKRLFAFDGDAAVKLPARFTRYGIIVRATVNGRGLDFLLDSGASGLFIDPGVAHQLGLTPFGRYSETVGGGDVDEGDVRIPHMSIGPLDLDNVVFTTTPMSDNVGDARVVGLIGFDFLASGIFKIDFKNQTLTVVPRDHSEDSVAKLQAMPLQLDDGVPRTGVWVEGVHGHFMVDTGAFGLLMYKDFVDRLPSASGTDHNMEVSTVGGAMTTKIISVQDLIFSTVKFKAAHAVEPTRSTFDVSEYDGLIGRDVLSLFTCYFDYANGMLYTGYTP